MRTYLATLHTKPDHHKKRFAFLVSGTFTLFIFTIWSLVNFGMPEKAPVVAQEKRAVDEVTPFDSVKGGVAAALKALNGGFGELKADLEKVDVNGEYQEMRNRALESYDR